MLPPGSQGLHAAACGDVPPPGGGGMLPTGSRLFAKGGTRHPERVSYTPSCDPPDLPAGRDSLRSRVYKRRRA